MSQGSIPSGHDSRRSSSSSLGKLYGVTRKESVVSASGSVHAATVPMRSNIAEAGRRSSTASSQRRDSLLYVGRSPGSVTPVDSQIGRSTASYAQPHTPSLSSSQSSRHSRNPSVGTAADLIGAAPKSFSAAGDRPGSVYSNQSVGSRVSREPKSPSISGLSVGRGSAHTPIERHSSPIHPHTPSSEGGQPHVQTIPRTPSDIYGSPPTPEMIPDSVHGFVFKEPKTPPLEEEEEEEEVIRPKTPPRTPTPPLLSMLLEQQSLKDFDKEEFVLRSQPTSVAESQEQHQQQQWVLTSQPVSEAGSKPPSEQQEGVWKLSSEPPATESLDTDRGTDNHSRSSKQMSRRSSNITSRSTISNDQKDEVHSNISKAQSVPLSRKSSSKSTASASVASSVTSRKSNDEQKDQNSGTAPLADVKSSVQSALSNPESRSSSVVMSQRSSSNQHQSSVAGSKVTVPRTGSEVSRTQSSVTDLIKKASMLSASFKPPATGSDHPTRSTSSSSSSNLDANRKVREALAAVGSRPTSAYYQVDKKLSTSSLHSQVAETTLSVRSETELTVDTETALERCTESESVFTEEIEIEEERVPTIDGGVLPVVGRPASIPAKREDLTYYTAVFGEEKLSQYRSNPIRALDIDSASVIQNLAAEFMDEIDNLKLTLIAVTEERDDLKKQNAHLLELLSKRVPPPPSAAPRPEMPPPPEPQKAGAVGGVILNWVTFQKQLRAAQAEAAALRAELTTQEILASRAALAENALQRAEIVIAEAQQAYNNLAECREGDIKNLSSHNRELLSVINERVPREELHMLQNQLLEQEASATEQARLAALERERLLKEAQEAQRLLSSLEKEFSEREASLKELLRSSGDEQLRLLQQLLMKERDLLPGIRERLAHQRDTITGLLRDKKLLLSEIEKMEKSVEASETLAACTEAERAQLSEQLEDAKATIEELQKQLKQALDDAKEVPALRKQIALLEQEIDRLKEEIRERDRKYLRFQDLLDELGVKHKAELERAAENAISRTRAEAGELVGRQFAAINKLQADNNNNQIDANTDPHILHDPLIHLVSVLHPERLTSPIREPVDRMPL
eukprot:TRINITY_DN37030_c0_g1_i1.p1 TRINITY_DN37030_c0_g1~~TRINITY_DN37030_c0_g1_i1.p1  ORF type:complete len:1099 (+),score=267.24 TRINITY_DN37030_c0_g1_i1:56-3298(+)